MKGPGSLRGPGRFPRYIRSVHELLFSDAHNLRVVRLLIHELTGRLVALGPVLFAFDLRLQLSAILDRTYSVIIRLGAD